MGNVSDKLSDLVKSDEPEREVSLNVMLRKNLDREKVAAVAEELARLSADKKPVEVLSAARMVLMKGKLGSVRAISEHPGVEWVDHDTEAPIEDLIDS
ncbi:MAG: hypothetical protein LC754_00145 [Acidobacteria bacterium]|nr:hypothetical protein [Acidobacteriota bacterium]